MARQRGKGLGSWLRKRGKKYGKKIGKYALQRAKAIGRAEARRLARNTLTALPPQKGGVFRGRTRQRGRRSQRGGLAWGSLAKIGLNVLQNL